MTPWKTIDRVGDNAVVSNTNLGSFYIQTVSLGIITLHFPLSQYMTEWAASIKIQWWLRGLVTTSVILYLSNGIYLNEKVRVAYGGLRGSFFSFFCLLKILKFYFQSQFPYLRALLGASSACYSKGKPYW